MRNLQKRFSILTILIMITIAPIALANSDELTRSSQPQGFLLKEIGYGWTGGFLGGIWGYFFFNPLVQLILPSCQGFVSLNELTCKLPWLIGPAIGGAFGASKFVMSAGRKFGIAGNAPRAYLGSGFGALVGILLATTGGVYLWSPGVAIIIAAPTGIMAALGYNLGATMEVKMLNVNQDRLELVSTRVRW